MTEISVRPASRLRLADRCLLLGGAVLVATASFSNALIEITTVLLLWGLVGLIWRRRLTVPGPLNLLVGLWLAACLVSVLNSTEPAMSWRALLRKTLPYAWLAVAGAHLGRGRDGDAVLRLLAWTGVFIGVDALAQGQLGHDLLRGRFMHGSRLTGPFNSPNNLASYLLIVLPLQVWVLVRGLRPWRATVLGVGLIAETAALMRTDTRIVWVTLIAVLLIILVLTGGRRVGVVGGLVLAGVMGVWGWQGWAATAGGLRLDPGRVEGWSIAWTMFRDAPAWGVGLGTYMHNYLGYPLLDGAWPRPQYAHNCYLQILAEGGLLGLGTFLALLSWVAATVARNLWVRRGASDGLLPGLAAALAGLLVNVGFDTGLYSVPMASMFWFLLGLAAGMATRPQTANH